MKTGGGIIHSEMPAMTEGKLHGFQLWINMPAKLKMNKPEYIYIDADKMSTHKDDDKTVKVIAGKFQNAEGPVKGHNVEPVYFDIEIEKGKEFNFNNKKALIIATNHGVLNKPNETIGKPTGLFLSELSIPYFEFKDANIDVTIASINGGLIPVEPTPWFIETKEDRIFNESSELTSLLTNSLSIKDLDFTEFDIVFL